MYVFFLSLVRYVVIYFCLSFFSYLVVSLFRYCFRYFSLCYSFLYLCMSLFL